MGHLLFAGMFVFFAILMVCKLYFSYICAVRSNKDDKEQIVEPSEYKAEKQFYVKSWMKAVAIVLIFLDLLLLIYFCRLLKETPDKSDSLWFLIDLLILGFFVFIVLLIKCLRSYIHIHQDGFVYREIIRSRAYSKKDVEKTCRTSEVIFIKLKKAKMPVIIETIYKDGEFLYKMLRNLGNRQE